MRSGTKAGKYLNDKEHIFKHPYYVSTNITWVVWQYHEVEVPLSAVYLV